MKRVSSNARVGQYMHRFGCFISRLGTHRFRTRRRTSCSTAAPAQPLAVFNGARRWRGRSLRLSAACLHAFGFSCSAAASLAESLRGAVSYATAAKLMLYTNADTRPNGVFRVQRFGCYTAAMASLQLSTEPLALEPKIDRTQPRAALGGALRCALLQARDLWLGRSRRPADRITSKIQAL